jgi:hypothetical protein
MLVLGVVALVVAACTSSDKTAAPDTTLPPETTTTVAATTTSARPTTTSTTVRATTTTALMVALGPGDASIGGTVLGPGGPVDGATVRIERLVGRSVATADVTTTGGGSWQMASILGGSYRVRAFKAPDLGQSPVESFFLAANERRTLDLRLPAVGGDRITASVSPSPPRVDQPATVTVQVGVGRVDDQGRPAITPRPGVVLTLAPGPGIVLESVAQVITDGNGAAAWRIRCAAEGADSISLTVGPGVTSFKLPPCAAGVPSPATTTTRG